VHYHYIDYTEPHARMSNSKWLSLLSHNLQAVLIRLLGQKLQIHPPIRVDEEHILTLVAPLRDVMGTTTRNCPR